ncbi:hypothetical protein ACFV1B_20535 [Streptomyces sp. NPDC059637]
MNPPLPAHGLPAPGTRHHVTHGHGHGHGSGAPRGGALPDGEAAA